MDQASNENLNVSPSNGVVGSTGVINSTGIVNITANTQSVARATNDSVNAGNDNDSVVSTTQNQGDSITAEVNPFQALLDNDLNANRDSLPEASTAVEPAPEAISSDENTGETVVVDAQNEQDVSDSGVSEEADDTEEIGSVEVDDVDVFIDDSESYGDESLSPYEKETIEAIAGCQQDAEVLLKVASVPLDYESATPLDRVAVVLTEEYIKRRSEYPLREDDSENKGGDNDQMKAFDHLLSTLGFVRDVNEENPKASETRIIINPSNTALVEGKSSAIEAFKNNMDKLADDLEQEKNSLELQLSNYREQCQREAEEREARIEAIQARFGL